MKRKIQYNKYITQVVEIELEFPFYLKFQDSESTFHATRVNEDLTYVTFIKESFDGCIRYSSELGDSYNFYEALIENQDQELNKEFFHACVSEVYSTGNAVKMCAEFTKDEKVYVN